MVRGGRSILFPSTFDEALTQTYFHAPTDYDEDGAHEHAGEDGDDEVSF
jgi:hypothetical protein